MRICMEIVNTLAFKLGKCMCIITKGTTIAMMLMGLFVSIDKRSSEKF